MKVKNKNGKFQIQFFANLDDVISGNAEAFGEGDTTKETFEGLQTKLQGLGYDVLLNHRESAEFVPSSRLSDVVGQREAFKLQAESAIKELNALKEKAGVDEDTQKALDELVQSNERLLKELQDTSIQMEIMTHASDAINPKDVLPFINMESIKVDKKTGKVTGGVAEELTRLRTEKPYMFKAKDNGGQKGGFDGGSGGGGAPKADMNTAIRRAAFGGSKI